jgi:hypothetical protein
MDEVTKKLLSRPSLELEYQNGKSPRKAHEDIQSELELIFQSGRITRNELVQLKELNDLLWDEYEN